jgi:hypothetical protein
VRWAFRQLTSTLEVPVGSSTLSWTVWWPGGSHILEIRVTRGETLAPPPDE